MGKNPHRGESEVVLNGRNITLRVDYNAIARLEDATGVSFLDPDLAQQRKALLSVRFIRAAIACCAREKISVDEVGEALAERGKILEAGTAFNQALGRFFSGALPQAQEEEADDRPPPMKEPHA